MVIDLTRNKIEVMRTKIKLCGFCDLHQAREAALIGADAIGVVFYDKSPRYLSPNLAAELFDSLPAFVERVGLFVNETPERVVAIAKQTRLSLLQFHGDETPDFCQQVSVEANVPFIRALSVKEQAHHQQLEDQYLVAGAKALLVDTPSNSYGGTGQTFDWSVLLPLEKRHLPLILSGGLNVDNIRQAIELVKPFAIDVSSGIESGAKGVKDIAKIRQIIELCIAISSKI